MSPRNQLQDKNEWDWDKAEVHPPVKSRRVVVSVAFKSPEFQRVSSYASKIGKRTSEFVREAAIRAVPASHPSVVSFAPVNSSTSAQGPRVTSAEGAMTALALAYQLR